MAVINLWVYTTTQCMPILKDGCLVMGMENLVVCSSIPLSVGGGGGGGGGVVLKVRWSNS